MAELKFKDFKIKTKMLLVLGISLLLILIMAIINYQQVNAMRDSLITATNELRELELVSNMGVKLSQYVMPANDYLIKGGDPNEKKNFIRVSRTVENTFVAIETSNFAIMTEEEVAYFSLIKELYFKSKKIAIKIFNIPKEVAVNSEDAGRLMEEVDSLIDKAILEVEKWREYAHKEVEESEQSYLKAEKRVVFLNLLFTSLIFIVAIAFATVIIRSVVGPIIVLSKISENITKGDYGARAIVSSKDEIGRLATSFNMMLDSLVRAGNYTKAIISTMPVSLFVASSDGKLIGVNQSACALLNKDSKDLLGREFGTIFATTTTTTTFALLDRLNLKELREKGVLKDFRADLIGRDKEKIPVSLSGSLLYDDKGKPLNIILIAKDIRELTEYAKKRLLDITPILKKVSRGNFDEKISIKQEEDEFTEHLVILNQMIDDFKKMLLEIKSKSFELDAQNVKLKNYADDLERARGVLADQKDELEHLNVRLEEKVKRRTEELEDKVYELERFNSVAVGRELKMVELKDEIRLLREEMGKRERIADSV